jgi:transcriptional regulator with XRE-family HTH domain
MWLEQGLYKLLGKALAEVREDAELTQQELARRLLKPQSFVSSYETGQRRLDVLEFAHIVTTLGLDPVRTFATLMARLKSARGKR